MNTKKTTILVADDDPKYLKLLYINLENLDKKGYRILTAADGAAALRIAEAEKPDLLVLDIMMPIIDGLEVCRRVREFSTAPIIILTAKDSEDDKVLGLDSGADDYITKPFGRDELISRVKAQLRRAQEYTREEAQPSFTSGSLTVDFAQHQASIDGKPVNLTPTEYRILAHLARNAGRVVTQPDLLSKVWGPEYKDEAHLLRVNIARLRQKVEEDPGHPSYILTRPGIGYTLAK